MVRVPPMLCIPHRVPECPQCKKGPTMAGKCEHGLTTKECLVCASPKYGALKNVAAGRGRNAGWFALVMNAAAALEDAANCLRDPDAKRAAEGAAKHYRAAANAMWAECVGPNVALSGARDGHDGA